MSYATELHDEIMAVIMARLKDNRAAYADVFGALAVTKAFFEVEYAGRLAATWKSVLADEEVGKANYSTNQHASRSRNR